MAALVARQKSRTHHASSLGSWNTRSITGSVAFARPRFDRLLTSSRGSWFTDNPLLKYARQPWNQTQYELDTGKSWTYGQDPSVVRIDCGSFTGTYTINEDDNYVWFKDYAWVMNLMCAIPIFGIVMLVWLIANHEHVTCFNRKKVRDWAASAQRRGSNVDLAARAEAQADTTDSRCGGCLCCCGPRPDVLVEHEAQREARIAAHRGVLPGLEPDAGEA